MLLLMEVSVESPSAVDQHQHDELFESVFLKTPLRDVVHGGQELHGLQKRRDKREHGLGGGGPAEV